MAAYPPTPQPYGPSSRVELRISCKKLMRGDILTKSDPLVAVYTYDQRNVCTEVGTVQYSFHAGGQASASQIPILLAWFLRGSDSRD